MLNGLAFTAYLHLRGIKAQMLPFECRLALCLDKLISHTGKMLLKKRPHCDSFSGQDHKSLKTGLSQVEKEYTNEKLLTTR